MSINLKCKLVVVAQKITQLDLLVNSWKSIHFSVVMPKALKVLDGIKHLGSQGIIKGTTSGSFYVVGRARLGRGSVGVLAFNGIQRLPLVGHLQVSVPQKMIG
jgi:hypothetical protein